MLTYQVRKRIFRLEENRAIAYPADVAFDIVFNPLQPFGSSLDGGKTCVKAVAASALFNANTGHHSISSKKPLSPLDVTIQEESRKLQLAGNVLSVSQKVETLKELDDLIQSLFFTLPMLLNIEFVDPPYIERIGGTIGDVNFRWELTDWKMYFETTTQELQEQKVVDSWERHSILAEFGSRRLFAALHYFHVACRLGRVGNSPWEFMAEILLNYCKMLEVLFPSEGEAKSIEITRRELTKLGLDKEEIEKYYIPAIALRNKIDVAHVDLSIFTREQLQVLHSYTESAEFKFRDLLLKVFSKLADKSYCVPEYTELSPRREAVKTIESMAKNFDGNNA